MPGTQRIRPPWWLKPMNKVGIQMSRLGLRVRLMKLSADEARPLLREWPSQVPGVGFIKRAGLVTDGRPEEFAALAGRCAVFHLQPLETQ